MPPPAVRGHPEPLTGAFAWYADFFDLFGDFVDHFLLNDLVENGHNSVRFFTFLDDFGGSPLPAGSMAEYR